MTTEQVNMLLKLLADKVIDDNIEAEYDKMVFEMFAGHEQLMYASQSYTNDSIAYGSMI